VDQSSPAKAATGLTFKRGHAYLRGMTTVAEIEAALPQLSIEQLVQLEQSLHQQYRRRGGDLVYDGSYGVVTEADLIAAAEEALLAYDKEEANDAQHRYRAFAIYPAPCSSAGWEH